MDNNASSHKSSKQSAPSQQPGEGLQQPASISLIRLLAKTILLLMVFNLAFAALQPIPLLERLTGYNRLYPGRVRLPFGEIQEKAYNLSLYQLDAMFLSHEIAAGKPAQEYRVAVIGDSSVWGYLLRPEQTLTAYLNMHFLSTSDGKRLKFYNSGYPTITLTKDLLILKKALAYQPDMVIWLTTLEAFPYPKQLSSPIVQNNPVPVRELIKAYDLPLDLQDPSLVEQNFWQKTILGQRRSLADLFRLQIYGILWAATGIDQYYPDQYDPPQADLEPDENFYNLAPGALRKEDLAFSILSAGLQTVGQIPVLLVNEPIYISQGENSNIRYNFFYPRWAYDQYRSLLAEFSQTNDLPLLDVWDLNPPEEFTNSAIHMTPAGTERLAGEIVNVVSRLLEEYDAP